MPTLQADLFQTKEQALEIWCKQQGFFNSHEANYYGTTHYYDSATRRIREWVDEHEKTGCGKVRRLSDDEKVFRGFKTKCAVYEWIKRGQENAL